MSDAKTELEVALCVALGLEPHRTRALTLEFRVGELPVVTAELWNLGHEQKLHEPLQLIRQRFTLQPNGDPEELALPLYDETDTTLVDTTPLGSTWAQATKVAKEKS